MNLYKYPRTPHLPFSKGMISDDKVLDLNKFYRMCRFGVTWHNRKCTLPV